MKNYILAIDQGTTGTTVALMDQTGTILKRVTTDYPQIYPKPGWVEHDPEVIWNTVTKGIEQTIGSDASIAKKIAAVGITNQRETVLAWDSESGKPLYNAIVWQCRRTTEFCLKLKKKGLEKIIKKKTGLVIDPYFSSSKINWLIQNIPEVKKGVKNGKVRFGTIDSFLIWKLSGGEHKTDVSNASRTQLMNIKTGKWDSELLKIFGVPEGSLPEISPSSGIFATTKGLQYLPEGVPISGVAGDQQAALFGQACFASGMAKCTFGTGSFLLMNTGHEMVPSQYGMLTTVAWQLSGQKKLTYALEGGAFICGAAVQFLRDQMGFIKNASEIEKLALSVPDAGGVEFIPALAGLGAPYWRPDARGVICGLTRGTNRGHIARATLEAMALQNVDILVAMQKDLRKKLKEVRVDGGAAANSLLMQIQSDYLGVMIRRPQVIETTVAGAAFLAGLGVGLWSDLEDIEKIWHSETTFEPHMSLKNRSLRREKWLRAVERTF